MRAGRFVGRVGGLAVALGVGVAVASSPGVAWADDSESVSSDRSTGTASATGTNGTSESQGTPTTAGTTAEPAGKSPAAGTKTEGASTPGSGSANPAESGTSASGGASVRQVPPGMVNASGGANSPTKSNSETSADGGVGAELTTDDSTLSKPGADSTAPSVSKPKPRRSTTQSAEPNATTKAELAAASVAPSSPRPAELSRTVVDVAVNRHAAPQAVTAVTDTTKYVPPQADFVAQTISAAPEEPPLPRPVSAIVLSLLASLRSLATNGPLPPLDSPLGLALAAIGTRSRQFGQAANGRTQSLPASSTLTSLVTDAEATADQQTFATMVAATNSAPNVPAQPVGMPNPVTGVVTGTVIATDPDNNALTYTVAGGPTKGTVALNSQTGAYTYTATPVARLAAGATALADTDTFTVAVSDGQTTTTAPVSVYVSPTRLQNQTPIAMGRSPSAVAISSAPNDPRMYVANTGSNTVSVINTTTGQRIDANTSIFSTDISVGSSPSALAASADGKRLYVANTGSGTVSVINTDNYTRIDANTSIWSTDISVGSSPSALALSADGKHLYVANRGSNTVSVINTTTNQLVDSDPNVSGTQSISVGTSPSALALSGTQLYVANRGNNTVSVINTSTNSVTNTIIVGSQPSSLALGADGRLYVTNAGSNSVSVINTVTNTLVDTNPNVSGTQAISVGPSPSSVALSPNGSFAYVANANDTVSVIDIPTYTVVSTATIDSDTTGGHVIAVSLGGTVYVTDAVDNTVRVLAVTRGNTAPIAGTPSVTANTVTGVVSGALNFTDADGDTLSYSVTQPSAGTVSITSGGVYTFSPTAAARQAAANGGPTSASFTVNATDGQASTPISVTVPVAPAAATIRTGVTLIGSNVTVTGYLAGQVFTPDGTRVVISATDDATTLVTRVVVVNTSTAGQVGTTLTLPGMADGSPLLSVDGTRAVVTTHVGGDVRVAVINTTTGAQVGTTFTTTGDLQPTLLSANGTRAVITTTSTNLISGGTRVSVIDTTTGTQIGTTLLLPGYQSSTWRADDTHALTITSGDGTTTRVVVTDAITGTQTGTTLTLTGGATIYQSPLFSAMGTRALITTADGAGSTRVAVVDTTTGTQVGTTLTLAGTESAVMSADAKRALITTRVGVDEPATHASTLVTIVDPTTGNQIGTTLTLAGGLDRPAMIAGAGRALITTVVTDASGIENTQVTVINTTTGNQTGATLTLTGRVDSPPVLSADGTRALIANNAGSAVIINTATGTQTGPTLTLTGQPAAFQLVNADGTRALITTRVTNLSNAIEDTTLVTVINTATGAQIGTTLTVPGYGASLLTADGTRALITTAVYDRSVLLNDRHSTRVAVINTATGQQIGTTLTLPGVIYGAQLLSANGTHVLVTTSPWNPWTYTGTTQTVVIDTTTGKQAGSALTIAGGASTEPLFSPNGTRILITTAARNWLSQTITRVAVLRIV